jgi:predicted nucleic acid-binding protein
VRLFFDTSVIVAAAYAHPQQASCKLLLESVGGPNAEIQGFVHLHTLSEAYSVLTRLPIHPGFSPEQVVQLLRFNLASFEIISLEPDDYWTALERIRDLKISGGAIFDALLAQAALKARADKLYTLNAKHFLRLGEDVAQIVHVPS